MAGTASGIKKCEDDWDGGLIVRMGWHPDRLSVCLPLIIFHLYHKTQKMACITPQVAPHKWVNDSSGNPAAQRQEGHPACKNWVVSYWHGYLSEARCLTVFFHNLCPSFLWSISWSGTLHFILHTFLHQIIVLFSEHMPIPLQPVLLWYRDYVI